MARAPIEIMPEDEAPYSGIFVEHDELVLTEEEIAVGELSGFDKTDVVIDGHHAEVLS